jgi:Flp pilus assembly protein CpaB
VSNTSLTTKVQQSRGWTLALGIAAAVLAGILLVAYLVQYRSSVNDSTAQTPVLVAKNLIPKGTSGTVIAQKQLFQAATLAKNDLKVGAISDPAYLNGRVAVADIFPGQQITTADLSAGLTDAIPTQLSGLQRAVALSIGATQGLAGYVSSGDRVDIYYQVAGDGGTVLGLIAPNVLVMRAAANGAPVVLRADAPLAQKLALASSSGTLWFLLRPSGVDAKKPPRKSVTSQQLLQQISRQPKVK